MILTERKLRNLIRKVLVEKKFAELDEYEKNKEINVYNYLMDPMNTDLRDEFFEPINNSYMTALGQPNADIQTAAHLMNPSKNDYVDFLAWDIDDDPQPDVIRGMKPKSGFNKLSLSATDGSDKAKNYAKQDTVRRLMDGAHWAEMSGPAAGVAMKNGVTAITDPQRALALVNKPNVQWYGEHPYFTGKPEFADLQFEAEYSKKKATYPGQYDGWYVRMLGNPAVPHVKMVFGAV